MEKTYTIRQYRESRGGLRTLDVINTLPGLIDYFGYTLMKGKSWEHERGNKKINTHPKTAASLVTNLNNAERNAAANGCPSTWYELI